MLSRNWSLCTHSEKSTVFVLPPSSFHFSFPIISILQSWSALGCFYFLTHTLSMELSRRKSLWLTELLLFFRILKLSWLANETYYIHSIASSLHFFKSKNVCKAKSGCSYFLLNRLNAQHCPPALLCHLSFVSNTAVLKNCGLGACWVKHDILPAFLSILVNSGYFTSALGSVFLWKGHTCQLFASCSGYERFTATL